MPDGAKPKRPLGQVGGLYLEHFFEQSAGWKNAVSALRDATVGRERIAGPAAAAEARAHS
jgi:hypothetical protein